MRRLLTAACCLGLLAPTLGRAAEPRDTPVLADFSEADVVKEPLKPLEGDMLTTVSTAMAEACADKGEPQAIRSYKGSFHSGRPRQQLHLAKCGTQPFFARHVFAVTSGTAVVTTGEVWEHVSVRHIEDVDGDGFDEVLLQNEVINMGVKSTKARLVSFKPGTETMVTDFGTVFTGSDRNSNQSGCHERAAVIFLKVLDPSTMTRKDYGQPCGADKAWAEIGEVPLLLAD